MSAPRRVPPPCWTQDETVALINAYREKWYSVNRGNLRAADWDSVSTVVAESSSSAQPPKSSLQCRHKIEKLRKRYRSEKQRCLNFPGRFSSSWDLFPLLDAMSIGSPGSNKQCLDIDEGNEIGEGFRLKTLGDMCLVAPNRLSNVDQDFESVFDSNLDPNLAFRARKFSKVDVDSDTDSAARFYPKSGSDLNSVSVAFRPKDYGRIDGTLKPEIDFQSGVSSKLGDRRRSLLPQVAKFKGYGKIVDDSSLRNTNGDEDYSDYNTGFPLRTLGDLPPGYKAKYRKTDVQSRGSKRYRIGGESVVDCFGSPPSVSRPNNYCKGELDSDVLNGIGDVMENGVMKLKDPIKELVSAISMSTSTFVKVEKMKMELAMEIEKMRMDNLLKHNQMILESQQQIVDALVKAASVHNRNKRKEFEVVLPNGDSEFAATNCACACQNDVGEE